MLHYLQMVGTPSFLPLHSVLFLANISFVFLPIASLEVIWGFAWSRLSSLWAAWLSLGLMDLSINSLLLTFSYAFMVLSLL